MQTVQTQIRRRKTRDLIRVYTIHRKFYAKYKTKTSPETPKYIKELLQMMTMVSSNLFLVCVSQILTLYVRTNQGRIEVCVNALT